MAKIEEVRKNTNCRRPEAKGWNENLNATIDQCKTKVYIKIRWNVKDFLLDFNVIWEFWLPGEVTYSKTNHYKKRNITKAGQGQEKEARMQLQTSILK